ncbi:MAG: carboxylating nicotinate-nucleotide diphosphorylase [Calditrichaeota bacterium]|nr:MAG: carboxylating nicotinate-nucleotide diphosphorylase [Calditrichota bacterium]
MQRLNWPRVQWMIEQALMEDLGPGDVTTAIVHAPDRPVSAKIVSKDKGVLAGLVIAQKVFHTRDPGLEISLLQEEGVEVKAGDELMHIRGAAPAILQAERTALNILGRCCGIASQTRKFVKAVEGYPAKILDTRKTAPLLRELDKYAVRVGGGENHRHGLFDMILLKENHIRWAGGVQAALQNLQKNLPRMSDRYEVEVEVTSLAMLEQVLKFPVDRILLDNFDLPQIQEAVRRVAGRVALEVSGGVQWDNVRDIAATGVDYISVGALTHSVQNFDLTLLF